MKHLKKLSLFIVLFMCFTAQAQRIDFYLNHQPGIKTLSGSTIKVLNSNNILVAYLGVNNQNDTNNYLSLLRTDGRLIRTEKLGLRSEYIIKAVDENAFGYSIYSESSTKINYRLSVSWYDKEFNHLSSSLILSDSIFGHEVYFAYSNQNIAILRHETGVYLDLAKVNDTLRQVKFYPSVFDTLPSHGFVFKWIIGNDKPYLNMVTDSLRFVLFNDTFGVVSNTAFVMNADVEYGMMQEKLYTLKPTGAWPRISSGTYLSNLNNDTLFCCISFGRNTFVTPYYSLFSTRDKLFAINSFSYFVNDSETVDSLAVLCFDSTVALSYEIHIPQFDVKNIDATTSLLVMMGGFFKSDGGISITSEEGITIYAFGKMGLLNGVGEFLSLNHPTVYPNPASNTLNFSEIDFQAQVQLVNTQGQLVLNTTQTQNIDVSQLPGGLYFYKIINTQNQAVAQGKIIKQ